MGYELMNCGAGVGNHQVTEWADLKSVGKTVCNGAKSCPDEKYVDRWERPPAQSLQTYNGQSKSGASSTPSSEEAREVKCRIQDDGLTVSDEKTCTGGWFAATFWNWLNVA